MFAATDEEERGNTNPRKSQRTSVRPLFISLRDFYQFAGRDGEEHLFHSGDEGRERSIFIVTPDKNNEAKGTRGEILLIPDILVNR